MSPVSRRDASFGSCRRIMPLSFFFAILSIVLYRMSTATPYYMLSPITGADILHAVTFMDRSGPFINGSFWSLPIELRWYFAFPVLLWLWTRYPRAFGFVAFVAVISPFMRVASDDLSWLPAFMIGIVAPRFTSRGHHLIGYALLALLAAVLFVVVITPSGFVDDIPNPAWQVAVFFMVIVAGSVPFAVRVLAFKPLDAICAASYSIYLVQHLALYFGHLRSVGLSVPGFATA